MGANRDRLTIEERDGVAVLNFGHVQIWDGADMALLRETLSRLAGEGTALGVEMGNIHYVPSGFFGLLCDCRDWGASVRLFSPRAHVRRMLWFRQFFERETVERYVLRREPKWVPAPPPRPASPSRSPDVEHPEPEYRTSGSDVRISTSR